MNVIWLKRNPDWTLNQQMEAAAHEELAIYEAARLMETKLTAWAMFLEPDLIADTSRWKQNKFHQLFIKNLRIYQRAIESHIERDLHNSVVEHQRVGFEMQIRVDRVPMATGYRRPGSTTRKPIATIISDMHAADGA